MNILFLSLTKLYSIKDHGIYADLLREFIKRGDKVFIISHMEEREKTKMEEIKESDCTIVKVSTGRIQKTNIIEKGINTVLVGPRFKKAIKEKFGDIKFDLILYSTPPITFVGAVEYVKKRDSAKTYLLLKDIFPQNSIDIGIMSKHGPEGIMYKYFCGEEKKLYMVSDTIGCMSEANCEYILKHNPEISAKNVEICPNSVEPIDMSVDKNTKRELRIKYDIPLEKKVFIYGGNLGKPQGIPFIIKCLEALKDNDDIFMLIVGDGTEYGVLERYIKNAGQSNAKLMSRLPKEDYDHMVGSCDVGLIFLDHRFTIPNFPSRLLAYMQAKIPVLACTDPNTDLGKIIEEGGFGWWCESNNVDQFLKLVAEACDSDLTALGNRAFQYLKDNYSVESAYQTIMKRYKGE